MMLITGMKKTIKLPMGLRKERPNSLTPFSLKDSYLFASPAKIRGDCRWGPRPRLPSALRYFDGNSRGGEEL
eukprot:1047711-Amorphochlora_amoeboformis.AAC.1